jgi:type IV pilus assembly protein PilW
MEWQRMELGIFSFWQKRNIKRQQGFTLVELLVALVITGVVVGGIYSAYYSQQKSYLVQEEVAGMQQQLRAAMHLIERDIRLAGYDPNRSAGAGIRAANANSIRFTSDIHDGADNNADGVIDEPDEEGNGDGDTLDAGEDMTYLRLDPDGNGVFDLYRRDAVAGTDQLLALNVDAINFVYLNNTGNITADLSAIRSVQMTMVVRAGRRDPGYRDTDVYRNQQDAVILPQQNDGFRRRLLSCEIKCRNLGL